MKKKPTPDLPRFASSNKQAASMLSESGTPCTAEHLMAAKKAGVRAFRSSRIYFEKTLFDWLEANPMEAPLPEDPGDDVLEPKEVLERRKLREQYLSARHRRLVEEGEYIALADYKERATRIVALFRASLNGLIADAPQWSGMPAHKILERASTKRDGALRELEAGFRSLANG